MKTYFLVLRREDNLLCLFIADRRRHWQYLVGGGDHEFLYCGGCGSGGGHGGGGGGDGGPYLSYIFMHPPVGDGERGVLHWWFYLCWPWGRFLMRLWIC